MVKRIFSFVLVLMLTFSSVQTEAADLVDDMMADLSREAMHFYNTQIAVANMTLTRPSANSYLVNYVDQSGKVVTIQLYKTAWGTWNLGDLNLVENGIVKNIMGGATDWEYVFRIYNHVTKNMEFMGGNHENERLNSIVFKDGVTGEIISLNVGESKYVARIVIEENTTIEIDDAEYMDLINVERVYTIVGSTINLDCKLTFVLDVLMSLSYTAMAPVNKNFARECSLGYDGGYVSTGGKGTCTKKYLGNLGVPECWLRGDDPSASVTVGIYNEKDMTDNFSNRNKTFLWDMSEEFNKLYFSKFSDTGRTKVEKGTVWNFGTYWRVNIQ